MIKRFEPTTRLSKVVVAGGFIFLSGLTAKDKAGDVRQQTADVLGQIDYYLSLAGATKRNLVSATIWLTDVSTFADMNAAWEEWVEPSAFPARATVQSLLMGKGSRVEIQAQAFLS